MIACRRPRCCSHCTQAFSLQRITETESKKIMHLWTFLSSFFPALCMVLLADFTEAMISDQLTEELLIRPLDNGQVISYLQLTTVRDEDVNSKPVHYHLFPKAVGTLLREYGVAEMHVSLTQGLWRGDKWGFPVRDAPPGVQLWVWFEDGAEFPDVDARWRGLSEALSGTFCASLNFIDQTCTTKPEISFRPAGLRRSEGLQNNSFIRYAALPRETVCTENLTPWKKLLPCGSRSGLATLLNSAPHLYSTLYHSLAVDVRRVCSDGGHGSCAAASWEFIASASFVFDPARDRASRDWSLRQLFGSTLKSYCPVADVSHVYLDMSNIAKAQLSPPPTSTETFQLHSSAASSEAVAQNYAIYDLRKALASGEKLLNIAVKHEQIKRFEHATATAVEVEMTVKGYGQKSGGFVVDVRVRGSAVSAPVRAVLMVVVPWYFQLYLHTVRVEGARILHRHFVPGHTRGRPYHLEIVLAVTSNCRVTGDFDLAFLKWTEYPPDANHGFYMPSAILTVVMDTADNLTALQHSTGSGNLRSRLSGRAPFFLRLHTAPLLISLPTPDFSMPYNVICLTCTVMAIAFGSIHNVTTRRLVQMKPEETSKLKMLFAKGKNLYAKWKAGSAEVENTVDENSRAESRDSDDETPG